ncbi:hypothetical protein CSUI_008125, partial [Cystoisospora suis]
FPEKGTRKVALLSMKERFKADAMK